MGTAAGVSLWIYSFSGIASGNFLGDILVFLTIANPSCTSHVYFPPINAMD